MKLWIAAVAALGLAACSRPPATQAPAGPPHAVAIEAPSGQYTLDADHSTINASALHFGMAHYTVRFNAMSGTLNFNATHPEQSIVDISVPTNSIDTPYAGDRDFDAELQNSEWLDAAGHPMATFHSTAVALTGSNTGRVTGDLTIRGVTHPITLDVTFNAGYRQHPMGMQTSLLGFSAHGVLHRSQYGLMVLQPRGGASTGVSDEVELMIEAEFQRPIEQADAPASTTAEPTN
jgi:polyisoprenoid-binding protein YceI